MYVCFLLGFENQTKREKQEGLWYVEKLLNEREKNKETNRHLVPAKEKFVFFF
jgi:hypothetical protein